MEAETGTQINGSILLKTPAAAAALSMSETQFRNQLAQGRIGPRELRFGKSVRYCRAELEAWARAGCPKRQDWERMNNGGD